ncbi:MAG: hypothetical protein WCS70_16435 [Verrucomicrobiota bacterium]
MVKVALKIKGLSDQEANDKVDNGVANCTGTQLATPEPAEVAAAGTAQANFEAALGDVASKKAAYEAAIQIKNDLRVILEQKYAKLGGKVEDIADTSGGGAAFIMARGFEVSGSGAPRMMTQVTGMTATPGDGEGKIQWMCDPQPGAIFLLQTSPDAMPRVWSDREPSKTSTGELGGFPTLTRVWVRAAAKGSNNTGAWSDPALVNVP